MLLFNSKVGPGFSHYLSNHDPEFWFPRAFLLSKNWKTFQKEEGCSKQYMTELETKQKCANSYCNKIIWNQREVANVYRN